MDDEEFTYDVRVWESIKEYVSTEKAELAKPFEKRKRKYSPRWMVAGRERGKNYASYNLAKRRRDQLTEAVSRAEAFHIKTGLPMSEYRKIAEKEAAEKAAREAAEKAATCLQRFTTFFDAKWPALADTARANLADSLSTVAAALVTDEDGRPERAVLNHTLIKYVFNKHTRTEELPSQEHADALAWIRGRSLPDTALAEDTTIRAALEAIRLQPTTGEPAALVSVKRKRAGFNQVLEYMVENRVLAVNPLNNPKWRDYGKGGKRLAAVDRAVVANPRQVEALIVKVGLHGSHRDTREFAPRLQAFFAMLYYCMMRPSEALDVTEDAFDLPPEPAEGEPETQWGTVRLRTSNPQASKQWTSDGEAAKSKSLKQRMSQEYRDVPIPPRGVYWVRRHIKDFNIAEGAQMFVGPNGGMVGKTVYARVWRGARQAALTVKQHRSPLAKRPYDLRHGGISLQLNAGAPPTLVAEWAGHSLEVMYKVYAKCIDGQEDLARRLIAEALERYEDAEEPADEDDEPGGETPSRGEDEGGTERDTRDS